MPVPSTAPGTFDRLLALALGVVVGGFAGMLAGLILYLEFQGTATGTLRYGAEPVERGNPAQFRVLVAGGGAVGAGAGTLLAVVWSRRAGRRAELAKRLEGVLPGVEDDDD